MHGVLPFLKPPGLTSHDAVNFARRALGTKRVGHGGTLDPAAAGVLPLGIGEGARLLPWLPGDKEYIAELELGYETDTLDAVGAIARKDAAAAAAVDRNAVAAALEPFQGQLQQVPPLYSAIKTDGVKGYERARAGEVVELPARDVTVFSLELLSFHSASAECGPRARLRVHSGAGFYVRSLIRDIGRALGCGATMTFLVRSSACGFGIEDAVTPEELAQLKELRQVQVQVPAQLEGPAAADNGGRIRLRPFDAALQLCAPRQIRDDALIADYLAGRGRWREAAAAHAAAAHAGAANTAADSNGGTLLVRSGIEDAAGRQAALLYEQSRNAFFWCP